MAVLLGAVLLIGGVQSAMQQIWAAERSTVTTTFVTNNQEDEAVILSLENGKLIVQSVPSDWRYKYVTVSLGFEGDLLTDDDFLSWFNENYEWKEFSTLSSAEIPLPKMDGTYNVVLDFQKNQYDDYWCIFEGDIAVKIENGIASFVQSPVYESNYELYKNRSTCDIALGYYTQPTYGIDSDAEKIKALAEEIVSDGDSDLEKIKKVHDWVTNNIWYDYDAYYSGKPAEVDAVEVLKLKRTVCSGYANLTAALLRTLDIPTKVISGYALGLSTSGKWDAVTISGSRSNHAWNEVYADGRWIILDTTWDSDNKYKKGTFSKGTGLVSRKYLDPTLEFFSADHKIFPDSDWRDEVASEISISKTSLTLKKGKTKNITVKTSGKYIHLEEAKITYSSSNNKVASVSNNGRIKVKKAGTAIIMTKVKFDELTLEFRTRVKVKR